MTNVERLVWLGRAQLVILVLILVVLSTETTDGELEVGQLAAAAGALLYGMVRIVARFAGSSGADDQTDADELDV